MQARKLKNSKLRLHRPNPVWKCPLPWTWEKQINSTPYRSVYIPYLARYDTFIFFNPNSYGRPWVFICRCAILLSLQEGGKLPEEGVALMLCSTCAYFCFYLTCWRLKACFSLVTWQLCLAHKCPKINKRGLYITSQDSHSFQAKRTFNIYFDSLWRLPLNVCFCFEAFSDSIDPVYFAQPENSGIFFLYSRSYFCTMSRAYCF